MLFALGLTCALQFSLPDRVAAQDATDPEREVDSTAAPPATSEDDPPVQESVARWMQLRERRRSSAAQFREDEDRIRAQIERLERELAQARRDLESERAVRRDLDARLQAYRTEVGTTELRLRQATDAAYPAALRFAARRVPESAPAADDEPWPVTTEPSNETTDPDLAEQIALTRRWLQATGEGWSDARSVRVRNQVVQLPDGRQLHAWAVDVGWVSRGFLSEDAHDAGIRSIADGPWQTRLSRSERRGMRQAVDMLLGQAPPALVSLPLWIDNEAGGVQ